MWELLINFIGNIIQLLVAIFLSLISIDVIKYWYTRPKINIQIYDLKNGNKAKIEHKLHFNSQKPFIHREKQYILTLTSEEFVILVKNQGRSTAKSISLFGWIPSDWEIELTDNGDLKGKTYSETKDWTRVMDGYHWEDIGEEKPFRISGDLLPTHVDYIKFNCKPDNELEVILAGENIIHSTFKIEL